MVEAAAELSRRERRKREVRGRILEAAVELFDAHGYQDTKVSEISDSADVAHKTFFNHFPTKQHLLQAIAEHSMNEQLAGIEELRKQAMPTAERIERLFEWVAGRASEAGAMRPELLHEIIRFTHANAAEGEARKLHDAFASIVRDGLEQGDVTRNHEEETLVEMLMGAYYVVMLNWTNFDGYPLRERARDAGRFLASAITVSRGDTR
ncbi:MAG: helix-turn-helix transcriptional regulator [Deltaproteobacteria bacterium]|nr:helix-turn-helix transcriptional regulator [Deltaproteobacteria bacterium]MBW2447346.1 helix-turn-helix transcriptional regulator [Deltaproteobacteria bacterium]